MSIPPELADIGGLSESTTTESDESQGSLPSQVKDFLDMFNGDESFPDDFPMSLRH